MRTGNEERKVEDITFLKAQLNQQLFMISQPNEKVMEAAWQRWDSIGKPLRSLGALERAVVKMAGMENTVNVKMDKRAIVVLCGDHGNGGLLTVGGGSGLGGGSVGLGSLGGSGGSISAAGDQGQSHGQNQQQGDNLLHLVSSIVIKYAINSAMH